MERAWVDCMDAEGRAMQEQLPRGDKKPLFLVLFVLKKQKNCKRELFEVSSPKPSPAREGLRAKVFIMNS